jgi:hypothetical protein
MLVRVGSEDTIIQATPYEELCGEDDTLVFSAQQGVDHGSEKFLFVGCILPRSHQGSCRAPTQPLTLHYTLISYNISPRSPYDGVSTPKTHP